MILTTIPGRCHHGNCDKQLSTNLKKIKVTVRYPDGGGQIRELVAVSFLNNDKGQFQITTPWTGGR
jgi:hypothetical protein